MKIMDVLEAVSYDILRALCKGTKCGIRMNSTTRPNKRVRVGYVPKRRGITRHLKHF